MEWVISLLIVGRKIVEKRRDSESSAGNRSSWAENADTVFSIVENPRGCNCQCPEITILPSLRKFSKNEFFTIEPMCVADGFPLMCYFWKLFLIRMTKHQRTLFESANWNQLFWFSKLVLEQLLQYWRQYEAIQSFTEMNVHRPESELACRLRPDSGWVVSVDLVPVYHSYGLEMSNVGFLIHLVGSVEW